MLNLLIWYNTPTDRFTLTAVSFFPCRYFRRVVQYSCRLWCCGSVFIVVVFPSLQVLQLLHLTICRANFTRKQITAGYFRRVAFGNSMCLHLWVDVDMARNSVVELLCSYYTIQVQNFFRLLFRYSWSQFHVTKLLIHCLRVRIGDGNASNALEHWYIDC